MEAFLDYFRWIWNFFCGAKPKTELPIETYFINGVLIKVEHPHLQDKLESVCKSPKFIKWLNEFNLEEIDMTEFIITDVNFFGPVHPNRLGFVKGYGKACDKITKDAIPAIAFLRGGAIAVLIVVKVKETGKLHVLLCSQLRFPVGRSMMEACAGMIDNRTKNVIGVVFDEVRQETGFILTEESLMDLGKIFPSPGGCDEYIQLYAWETEISEEEFHEKQRNVYGEGAHERIKLTFHDFEEFDQLLDEIGDVKAECCWRRYRRAASRFGREGQCEAQDTHDPSE